MATPGVQNTLSDSPLTAGRDNHINNSNTHNHYGNTNNVFPSPDPLILLKQHSALGALHDAAERPDPPKCHESTRTAILNRVDRWARDKSQNAKRIMWISGAAGSGKSAICQTRIEQWQDTEDEPEDRLVVLNFFLWRSAAQRNQKTHVVPTLAFQLAQLLPETELTIKEAVKNGSIFSKNLTAQVRALIVNPLRKIETNTKPRIVIVLDGLDECCMDLPKTDNFPGQNYEDQQREILDAIAFASRQVPSLRVLVASRPERQIRESFAGKPLSSLSLLLSLSHEYDAAPDITCYLDYTFAKIRSKHPGIDSSWPSKQQVAQLVEKSSGQFIYPSVVVKYISRPRQYPPTSLKEVLMLQPKSATQGGHPLAELNALYTLVLKTVTQDSWPIVMIFLGIISYYTQGPNIFQKIEPGHNTTYLEKFLLLQDGELDTHLTDLHSILSISKKQKDGLTKIRFFHATLSEYLQDKSRSGDFFIGESDVNLQISLLLLRHATIARSANTSVYKPLNLYVLLAKSASNSPQSKDLSSGLWNFLKGEIGEYSLISGSNSNLETRKDTHVGDQPKYFKGRICRYFETLEKCQWLCYLWKCNIAEIEPSKACRKAVDTHLRYLWKLVDPDKEYDFLFDVTPPQDLDTRDAEDSKEEHGEEEAESSLYPKGILASDTDVGNPGEQPSPPPFLLLPHDDSKADQCDQCGATKTGKKTQNSFKKFWLAPLIRFSQRKRERPRSI